jgi:Polyketide cyclase / dehydrase and lipid transport
MRLDPRSPTYGKRTTKPVLTYESDCDASPERAWELLARPDRWSLWAPHIRGARGLGEPEVRRGARGAALLLGVVPVPARITRKSPGRSWSWRVGGVVLNHRVEPRAGGCTIAIDLQAAPPLEALLRLSYGPVVALLVKNLARVAASGSGADERAGSPSRPRRRRSHSA